MLACSTAYAHVTAQPGEAYAGTVNEIRLRVPHGCEGSPTIALRVKMPDDVVSAKPEFKAGWTVRIKTRALAQPRRTEHGTQATAVDEIEWRGGPLPDTMYMDFTILVALPAAAAPTLYLPVVQECEKGVSRWIDLPASDKPGERLEHPAPSVRVKPR
jgi:uncharacterized protein YcnI